MSMINVHRSSNVSRKLGRSDSGGQTLGAVYSGKSGKSSAGAFCKDGSW